MNLVRCHGDQCHIFLRALPGLLCIPFLGHPSVKPHHLQVPAPAGWAGLGCAGSTTWRCTVTQGDSPHTLWNRLWSSSGCSASSCNAWGSSPGCLKRFLPWYV